MLASALCFLNSTVTATREVSCSSFVTKKIILELIYSVSTVLFLWETTSRRKEILENICNYLLHDLSGKKILVSSPWVKSRVWLWLCKELTYLSPQHAG